jgi:ribosome-associated protein
MSDTFEEIEIPDSDEALLNECEVQTFRSGGKGGQHVNKTETGVRLIHMPTGVRVSSTKERSQYRNKTNCLKRLRKKLEKLNHVDPERVETSKSNRVREKELQQKRKQAQKKELRKPPSIEDE